MMTPFEQTLRQAGVDAAAQSHNLDFALFTQPGMADAYHNHDWIVTHHPQIGAVINAVPALELTDTVPWEEWFRLEGELHHHVLYSVQKPESTETWQGPPDDPFHPPQVLGRLWHVHNDADSQPLLVR
jgi:hypothetical protein